MAHELVFQRQKVQKSAGPPLPSPKLHGPKSLWLEKQDAESFYTNLDVNDLDYFQVLVLLHIFSASLSSVLTAIAAHKL